MARGLDEYYAGTGELPGRWMGRGAEVLGLRGELDGDALDGILDGRDPRTGTRLTESTPKVIGTPADADASTMPCDAADAMNSK